MKQYLAIILGIPLLAGVLANAAEVSPQNPTNTDAPVTTWTANSDNIFTVYANTTTAPFVVSTITAENATVNPNPSATSASASDTRTFAAEPTTDRFPLTITGLFGGDGDKSPIRWTVTREQKFFWLSPIEKIVKEGTPVSITANGDKTSSLEWTVSSTTPSWTKTFTTTSGTSITLNENFWTTNSITIPAGKTPPLAGQYSISAKTVETSSRTANPGSTVLVVEIASITVTGATQTNVTGEKNWAAIKGTGDVIVTITLNPTVSENELPADFIEWTGGEAIENSQLTRKVSKATSAKTTVKAKCGTSEKEVDIWVIWCDIDILTSGNQPSGAPQFPPAFGGTTLGPYISSFFVGGKMTFVGNLQPAGINEVVKSGWKIKRLVTCRDWNDGNETSRSNSNDDSDPSGGGIIETPNQSDKIYDIDAPSTNHTTGFINWVESHNTFEHWTEWNNEKCSDIKFWSSEYKYTRVGAYPNKIYNRIQSGTITIPTSPTTP